MQHARLWTIRLPTALCVNLYAFSDGLCSCLSHHHRWYGICFVNVLISLVLPPRSSLYSPDCLSYAQQWRRIFHHCSCDSVSRTFSYSIIPILPTATADHAHAAVEKPLKMHAELCSDCRDTQHCVQATRKQNDVRPRKLQLPNTHHVIVKRNGKESMATSPLCCFCLCH